MNILVLNGPNLNLLGEREPEIYGRQTLADIEEMLRQEAGRFKTDLHFLQSNHEGVLIDAIHAERKWMDGLIFNPGALAHYSYALRDAVASVMKPMVEVHLSDLLLREEFRHNSVFQGLPNVRLIMGRGAQGYLSALRLLADAV
ncbi:MAG: type II 3-dehydroquinate dehydratase [Bacteroidota bacterium]|nr:type II 3-dehydroquinate dehydratase [Bacteroidota bacterium]MDP4234369.1 type II 3-dehydroquinate dehydratase [Bacteroidota bacterium]MDP4243302.1 type II 3-dehydroquinate dehydratase [Bacteroidota bacterium]MDP4287987.1 type II 3-dehydroquinate dehydratase [Bacteroidota bacterium]